MTDAERAAISAVLSAPSLAEQRLVQATELAREWREYLGAGYCIPTNSGTAALHMCVAALGIGPGDEVLVPAFTFWASAAAVLHHQAIPVFVDVEPDTWCIDPTKIEERITSRTKAIMVVHIHGVPADMDPIIEIAQRHGLKIIEDAAQVHGAKYKGRPCGRLGDVAGFSTQASKALTTGSEGGLFVTDSEEYYERALKVQYFGEAVVPGMERREQAYNAQGLGWMYRGDVLGQAFVRSQLKRLDEINAGRIANCKRLTAGLQSIDGVTPPTQIPGRESIYYNYVVRWRPSELGVADSDEHFRERVETALNAEGMFVGRWQRLSMPAQHALQQRVGYGKGCPWACARPGESPSTVVYDPDEYPVTEDFLAAHSYVFDIHPPNDDEVIDAYLGAIAKVLVNVDELPEPDPETVAKALSRHPHREAFS